ncbi:MAG TPA: signal recognition particle-docking protein FtsY [Actinophytocola sp.]|uniref:signal recognition particle-docking protein FtsY n=1 Tax=Actinophytocola sp. TaxID=1872138 RepID=UPI002DFCC44C|nr:signal recognition particle-docking protein FtsY [Actinophytocola sp.]
MSSTLIVIIVVLVVVAVALVAGVVLARRRRIDLTGSEPAVEEETRPGGYRAETGISLAPGGPQAAPEPVEVVEPAEPVEAAEPEPEPVEEIAPTSGRLERLRGRLARSRSTFGQGLLGLLGAGDLDEDSWTEVEDTLLMADLGSGTTTEVVERLRAELVSRGVRTSDQARALLREVLVDALKPDMDRAVRALPHDSGTNGKQPAVVLVAGVNGTGKTTTTGKLARVLIADGRTVVLGAADTFRAAAADQLQTWAQRVGAEVVRGKEGADPAAVAFDAVKRGIEAGVDAVLVDTAGRLHTKTGLMDELGKVKRVVEKQAKVDEVLLVLDATTGQNGLTQARVFREVVDVTGIVLTKLDGTAKGGIVFQVQRELGVPVKLVGLGEGADDLAPFEPGAFVDALLG